MPVATIANGATVSNEIELTGELIGIIFPAAMTGVALTVQSKRDDGTFVPVHNTAGAAISFTIAAARHMVIPRGTLPGLRTIKLVSGTAEGAARTLILVQE